MMPVNIQSSSPVVDLVVGVGTILFLLSAATMVIEEWLSQNLNWRGKFLERSILNIIISDQLVKQFYEHPYIRILRLPLERPGKFKLPSHIPSNLFANAMFDVLMNAGEANELDEIGKISIKQIRSNLQAVKHQNPTLGQMLNHVFQGLYQKKASVEDKIHEAKVNLELLFNEAMKQTSSGYKGYTGLWALIIGLMLATVANIDTLWIANRLWVEPTERALLVAEVQNSSTNNQPAPIANSDGFSQLYNQAQNFSLPIGWGTQEADCQQIGFIPGLPIHPGFGGSNGKCQQFVNLPVMNDLGGWLGKLFGIIISGVVASQGAPLCFDILQKLLGSRQRSEIQ